MRVFFPVQNLPNAMWSTLDSERRLHVVCSFLMASNYRSTTTKTLLRTAGPFSAILIYTADGCTDKWFQIEHAQGAKRGKNEPACKYWKARTDPHQPFIERKNSHPNTWCKLSTHFYGYVVVDAQVTRCVRGHMRWASTCNDLSRNKWMSHRRGCVLIRYSSTIDNLYETEKKIADKTLPEKYVSHSLLWQIWAMPFVAIIVITRTAYHSSDCLAWHLLPCSSMFTVPCQIWVISKTRRIVPVRFELTHLGWEVQGCTPCAQKLYLAKMHPQSSCHRYTYVWLHSIWFWFVTQG